MVRTYTNMGTWSGRRKEYEKAISHFTKAIKHLPVEQKVHEPLLKHNIAKCLYHTGKTNKAIDIYHELVEVNKNEDNYKNLTRNYIAMADAFSYLEQTDSSTIYLRKADSLAKYYNLTNRQLEINEKLISIHRTQNNYLAAFNLQTEQQKIQEELKIQENKVFEQELRENHKKEKERILEIEKQKQREIIEIGITCIFILVLLSLYIHVRRHLVLEKQKKELIKQKKEKAELELKEKRIEIFDFSTRLTEKNRILLDLEQELQILKKEETGNINISSIRHSLKTHLLNENAQKLIEEKIENANSAFFIQLREKHPNITSDDIQIMGLLRMKFSSKQISEILNCSERAIESKRYRLRKKMKLEKGDNLIEYILNLK